MFDFQIGLLIKCYQPIVVESIVCYARHWRILGKPLKLFQHNEYYSNI